MLTLMSVEKVVSVCGLSSQGYSIVDWLPGLGAAAGLLVAARPPCALSVACGVARA